MTFNAAVALIFTLQSFFTTHHFQPEKAQITLESGQKVEVNCKETCKWVNNTVATTTIKSINIMGNIIPNNLEQK